MFITSQQHVFGPCRRAASFGPVVVGDSGVSLLIFPGGFGRKYYCCCFSFRQTSTIFVPFFPPAKLTLPRTHHVAESQYHGAYLTSGCFSPTRAGVFFVTRMDGVVDIWDYFYRQNEVAYSHKVSPPFLVCHCMPLPVFA